MPRADVGDASRMARDLGGLKCVLPTREVENPNHPKSADDRCYHCKKELFVTVAQRRAEVGPIEWPVVYGAILDDMGDHRPGQRAAAEHGVLAPPGDAGFRNADRSLSPPRRSPQFRRGEDLWLR